MELLIAIILLGVLSSIGFQYYKNYYDVKLASKQTKVAVLIEQATQLRNMLELYNIKYGLDVTSTQGFDELITQGFLKEIPAVIPDLSASGWVHDGNDSDISFTGVATANQKGTASGDLSFHYAFDGTGSDIDKLDYCNAVNNLASLGDTNMTALAADINDTNTTAYIQVNHVDFFCVDSDTADDGEDLVLQIIAEHY